MVFKEWSLVLQETVVRQISSGDAPQIAELLRKNREAFSAWEPSQSDEYYTVAGQTKRVERLLNEMSAGRLWAGVIISGGDVIGQITVGTIVREPFRKGSVGYWVASEHQGRGRAKQALATVLDIMFHELDLHRAEASTQTANIASQKVLAANGFSPIGTLHSNIHINGAWRDGILWELVLDDQPRR